MLHKMVLNKMSGNKVYGNTMKTFHGNKETNSPIFMYYIV